MRLLPDVPARAIHALTGLALALLASSCVLDVSSPGVLLATSPPGARVFVDGADTGFATPCAIDLEPSAEYEVEFHLEGYAVARRVLFPLHRTTVVSWADGDIGATKWRFPTYLTFWGLFFPFRDSANLAAKRVYVPLEVATQEPVDETPATDPADEALSPEEPAPEEPAPEGPPSEL